jgi:hypothetical protein
MQCPSSGFGTNDQYDFAVGIVGRLLINIPDRSWQVIGQGGPPVRPITGQRETGQENATDQMFKKILDRLFQYF